MNMKSQKQVFIQYEQATAGSYRVTNVLMHLCSNKTYKSIKSIANEFGVKMPPRKGFVFLKGNELALWCIHFDSNPGWLNQLDSTGEFISEKKLPGEISEQFQKRIRKDHVYDAGLIRICFAKENGVYRFVGVFKLSKVDLDNQTCVFRRLQDPQIMVSVTRRKKVTVIIEEETTEEITII